MRKTSTSTEQFIWRNIRNYNFNCKFRRQHIISGYIVDFVCISIRLIIEIDGGQHMQQSMYDRTRTIKLNKLGYKVLRFWNSEVQLHPRSVLEKIYSVIEERSKFFGKNASFESIKHRDKGLTDVYYF